MQASGVGAALVAGQLRGSLRCHRGADSAIDKAPGLSMIGGERGGSVSPHDLEHKVERRSAWILACRRPAKMPNQRDRPLSWTDAGNPPTYQHNRRGQEDNKIDFIGDSKESNTYILLLVYFDVILYLIMYTNYYLELN